jgi:hypothetical protein
VAAGVGAHAVMTEEAERDWYEQASRPRDGQAFFTIGFREIGRRRGASMFMGRHYEAVLMDAIAPEFEGKALAGLTPEGGEPVL